MVWVGFAALVAVVAGVALLLWRRRGRHDATMHDEAATCRAAEAALSGFTAKRALIGEDHRAVLIVGRNGRVALLRPGTPVREIRWDDVRAVAGGLRIEAAGRAAYVNGVTALDVRRAGGEEWRPAR